VKSVSVDAANKDQAMERPTYAAPGTVNARDRDSKTLSLNWLFEKTWELGPAYATECETLLPKSEET
jgi:hypothetical protein